MESVKQKYELDTFQLESCNWIDEGYNILVSAPTGSGKTAIAEYAIEFTKNKNSTSQIIYTCPIKALCNEKYHDMVHSHSKSGSPYTIGLMTGDIIINPDGDIIIMTTEVLYNLMTNTTKEFNPGCVVFDEAHYINDDGRGHVWEKCIIYSLTKYNVLLVLLSATIGNIDTLIHWLNSINESKQFKKIVKTQRPVPLREYLIDNSKIRTLKKILDEGEEINVISNPEPDSYELLDLNELNYIKVKKYWDRLEQFNYSIKFELQTLCNQIKSNPNLGIPAIIFVLSKARCIKYAEMIETSFIEHEEQSQILHFFDQNLKEFNECSQYINLRKTISKGIAYHHSGLIPKIREVVEFLIKRKLIKIVFATETFAVGLNFPVKTVVMTAFNKPSDKGYRNIYVSEYKQMAGRAGRRFIDTVGNVIIWLYNDRNKIKNPYPTWNQVANIVSGPVDSVKSKFVIEPNFVLKNLETFKIVSKSSFKYYTSESETKQIIVPEKFSKIFDIDLKVIEFSKQGINYIDKNYKKLITKLSPQEKSEYNKFLDDFKKNSIKSDYEIFLDTQEYMLTFLAANGFIELKADTYSLTNKGEIASCFNEINPVLFMNHAEDILKDPENIIPILSMFIDDGLSEKEDEDKNIIDYGEVPNYFVSLVELKYSKFMKILPKWNFYPDNYIIIKTWLTETNISLDSITALYEIDMGLMVRILIKMYQIVDELIMKLIKINRTDLTNFLSEKKEQLIRYPLKLGSLYIDN